MIVDEIKTDSDITKEIDEIKAYFESKLKVGTDLSYEWIEKDENIKILSSIIFVNDKNIDTLLSKHDYGCELKLIKLITEDKRHKDNFVEVPKVCNRLNRYSNIIPCK